MIKDKTIATYELDDDKKQQKTMYDIQKILKEIKASMNKHGKIKVIIEKSE